ncbi:hypothetical protein BK133_07740 [Paenibacillus sp. FSL H8-0548]|uniref:hypothetical protein n=1 Tax=Paenibacillus sp. FSL H8-0548 TaxID=1920422 RepID=UPI00096C8213|nr:hypothetical protein [Paenibacillus sp. FSL H8-0548]OMF37090.1 hypothetical protein BK133_07740 [Paenibacillus sp. FSL H8-0548]
MNELQIDLYQDWINTVKEVFSGSGSPLPETVTDKEAALAYFLQTAESSEDAEQQLEANKERLLTAQQIILDHFETAILPDIRSRTSYTGDSFTFKWVYNQGEHVVEQHSMYRIPL